MGVGTKRVKRVLRNPALVRPSNGALLAISDDEPDIAVVYVDHDGAAVVVTVVWRSTVVYERTPGGWRARSEGAESKAA